MYIFENVLGIFVFDEHFKIIDELNNGSEKDKEQFRHKHKSAKEPDEKSLSKILEVFKDNKFNELFHSNNINTSRISVKDSVNRDLLISQAVNSYEELEKVSNSLAKRLREWYALYNPEGSASIENHTDFVKKILSTSKQEILDELDVKKENSMGAELNNEDVSLILSIAAKLASLYEQKDEIEEYISKLMGELCPNLKEVAGAMIGAKLISHAGSLKRLSGMPASTVQILGAETALFRHLKTGARPPRHGMIVNHPLISKAPERLHGKIARALADKLSIAVKVDYFKGEFIGDKLSKQLEEKLGRMK